MASCSRASRQNTDAMIAKYNETYSPDKLKSCIARLAAKWAKTRRKGSKCSIKTEKLTGRPFVVIGAYYRAHTWPTRNHRVQGYSSPRPDAKHIGTCAPGTYIGPVSQWAQHREFTAVLVHDWWIVLWRACAGHGGRGYKFATEVPAAQINRWRAAGWLDL